MVIPGWRDVEGAVPYEGVMGAVVIFNFNS